MARIFRKWIMSPETEIFVYGMAGITITAMEQSVLNANEYLKEVQNAPLPAGLFGPLTEQRVKTILSLAVLARSYTVYAYLFAYFAVLGVAFFGQGRFMLLPWLLLSVLRHFVVDVMVALTGVFICFKYQVTPVCGEFIAMRLLRIGTAAYMWRSVRMFYDELAAASRAARTSRRRPRGSAYALSQEATHVLNRALLRLHMRPPEEDQATAAAAADAATFAAWALPGTSGSSGAPEAPGTSDAGGGLGGSNTSFSVSSKPLRRHISAGITCAASVDCAKVGKRESRTGEDENAKLPWTRSLESLLSMLDYNAEALAPLVARRREERRAGEGAAPRQRALFFLRLTERDVTAARRRALRALVAQVATTYERRDALSSSPPPPPPAAETPERENGSQKVSPSTSKMRTALPTNESPSESYVEKYVCSTLQQKLSDNSEDSRREKFELSLETGIRIKEETGDVVHVALSNSLQYLKESIILQRDIKSETNISTEIHDHKFSDSKIGKEDENNNSEIEVKTEAKTEDVSVIENTSQSDTTSSKNDKGKNKKETGSCKSEVKIKSSVSKIKIEEATVPGAKSREALRKKYGVLLKERGAMRSESVVKEQTQERPVYAKKEGRKKQPDISPSRPSSRGLRLSWKNYSSSIVSWDINSHPKSKDVSSRSKSRVANSRLNIRDANSKSKSRDVNSRPKSRDANSRPTSRDTNSRPTSRDENSRPISRDAISRPKPRDSNSRPKSRDSNSRPKSRDSNSRPKSRDANSRPTSRDAISRPKSRDSNSRPKSRDSNSRPKSRDSNSRPKPRDSNSRAKSRDANSHLKPRDANSRSVTRVTTSHTRTRDSMGRPKSSMGTSRNASLFAPPKSHPAPRDSLPGKPIALVNDATLASQAKYYPFGRKVARLIPVSRDDSKSTAPGMSEAKDSKSRAPQSKRVESLAKQCVSKSSAADGLMAEVADLKLSLTRGSERKTAETKISVPRGPVSKSSESKITPRRGSEVKNIEPKITVFGANESKVAMTKFPVHKPSETKAGVLKIPEVKFTGTRAKTDDQVSINISKAGRRIYPAGGQVRTSPYALTRLTSHRLKTSLTDKAESIPPITSLPVTKTFIVTKSEFPAKTVGANKTSIANRIETIKNSQDILRDNVMSTFTSENSGETDTQLSNIEVVKCDVCATNDVDAKLPSPKLCDDTTINILQGETVVPLSENKFTDELSRNVPVTKPIGSSETLTAETKSRAESPPPVKFMKVTRKEIISKESVNVNETNNTSTTDEAEMEHLPRFRNEMQHVDTNVTKEILGKQISNGEIVDKLISGASSVTKSDVKSAEKELEHTKKSKDIMTSQDSEQKLITIEPVPNDSYGCDLISPSQGTALANETNSLDESCSLSQTEGASSKGNFVRDLLFFECTNKVESNSPGGSINDIDPTPSEASSLSERGIAKQTVMFKKAVRKYSAGRSLDKFPTNSGTLANSSSSIAVLDDIGKRETELTDDLFVIHRGSFQRSYSGRSTRSGRASFLSIDSLAEEEDGPHGKELDKSSANKNTVKNSTLGIHSSSLSEDVCIVGESDKLPSTAGGDTMTSCKQVRHLGSIMKDATLGDYRSFTKSESSESPHDSTGVDFTNVDVNCHVYYSSIEEENEFNKLGSNNEQWSHHPDTQEMVKIKASNEAFSIVNSVLTEAVNKVGGDCVKNLPFVENIVGRIPLESSDVPKSCIVLESNESKAPNEEATNIVRSIISDAIDGFHYGGPPEENGKGFTSNPPFTDSISSPTEDGDTEKGTHDSHALIQDHVVTLVQRQSKEDPSFLNFIHGNTVGSINNVCSTNMNTPSNGTSLVEETTDVCKTSNKSELLENKENEDTFSIVHSVLREIVCALDIKKSDEFATPVDSYKITSIEVNAPCDNVESKDVDLHPIIVSDAPPLVEIFSNHKPENQDSLSVVQSVLRMVAVSVARECALKTSSSEGILSVINSTSQKMVGEPIIEVNGSEEKDLRPSETTSTDQVSSFQKPNNEAFSIVRSVLKEIVTAIDYVRSTTSLTSATNISPNISELHLKGSSCGLSTGDGVKTSIDIHNTTFDEGVTFHPTSKPETTHIIDSILSEILHEIKYVCSAKSSVSTLVLQSDEVADNIDIIPFNSNKNNIIASITEESLTHIETSLDKRKQVQETSSIVYSILKDIVDAVGNVCSDKSNVGDKIRSDKNSIPLTETEFPTCAGDTGKDLILTGVKGDEIKNAAKTGNEEASFIAHSVLTDIVSAMINACSSNSGSPSDTILIDKPPQPTKIIPPVTTEEMRSTNYTCVEHSDPETIIQDKNSEQESHYIVQSVLKEIIPRIVSVCCSKTGVPVSTTSPPVSASHAQSESFSLMKHVVNESELSSGMITSGLESVDHTKNKETHSAVNLIIQKVVAAVINVGANKSNIEDKTLGQSEISSKLEAAKVFFNDVGKLDDFPHIESPDIEETASVKEQPNRDSCNVVHSVLNEIVSNICKACSSKFGVKSTNPYYENLSVNSEDSSFTDADSVGSVSTTVENTTVMETSNPSEHDPLNGVRSVLKEIAYAINNVRSSSIISPTAYKKKKAPYAETVSPEADLEVNNEKPCGVTSCETSDLDEPELLGLFQRITINSVLLEVVSAINKVSSKLEVRASFPRQNESSKTANYATLIPTDTQKNTEGSVLELSGVGEVMPMAEIGNEGATRLENAFPTKEIMYFPDSYYHNNATSRSEYSPHSPYDVAYFLGSDEEVISDTKLSSSSKDVVEEETGEFNKLVNEDATAIVRAILNETMETVGNLTFTHESDLDSVLLGQESLQHSDNSDSESNDISSCRRDSFMLVDNNIDAENGFDQTISNNISSTAKSGLKQFESVPQTQVTEFENINSSLSEAEVSDFLELSGDCLSSSSDESHFSYLNVDRELALPSKETTHIDTTSRDITKIDAKSQNLVQGSIDPSIEREDDTPRRNECASEGILPLEQVMEDGRINQQTPNICESWPLMAQIRQTNLQGTDRVMTPPPGYRSSDHPAILHHLSLPRDFTSGIEPFLLAEEPSAEMQAFIEKSLTSLNENRPVSDPLRDTVESYRPHSENVQDPKVLHIGVLKNVDQLEGQVDTTTCENPKSWSNSWSQMNSPWWSGQGSMPKKYFPVASSETPWNSPSLYGTLYNTGIVTSGSDGVLPPPQMQPEAPRSRPVSRPGKEEIPESDDVSPDNLTGEESESSSSESLEDTVAARAGPAAFGRHRRSPARRLRASSRSSGSSTGPPSAERTRSRALARNSGAREPRRSARQRARPSTPDDSGQDS